MTGRRRRCAGVALWIGAAAVASLSASRASAAPADAVGWWQRPIVDTSDLAVPVPTGVDSPTLVPVPDDGVYVANDPSGPRAIAAARFDDNGAAARGIVVRVAGDPLMPVGAALVACPVAPTWEAAANGPWRDRPEVDCDAAVPGRFVDDRTAVRFDLDDVDAFRTLRGIELAIQPAAGETATFAIAFQPPEPDVLAVRESTATPATPAGPATPSTGPVSRGDVVTPPPPPTTAAARGRPDVAAAPVPAMTLRAVPSSTRIATDGTARAGITAALALAAAGTWLVSGRPDSIGEVWP